MHAFRLPASAKQQGEDTGLAELPPELPEGEERDECDEEHEPAAEDLVLAVAEDLFDTGSDALAVDQSADDVLDHREHRDERRVSDGRA